MLAACVPTVRHACAKKSRAVRVRWMSCGLDTHVPDLGEILLDLRIYKAFFHVVALNKRKVLQDASAAQNFQ